MVNEECAQSAILTQSHFSLTASPFTPVYQIHSFDNTYGYIYFASLPSKLASSSETLTTYFFYLSQGLSIP